MLWSTVLKYTDILCFDILFSNTLIYCTDNQSTSLLWQLSSMTSLCILISMLVYFGYIILQPDANGGVWFASINGWDSSRVSCGIQFLHDCLHVKINHFKAMLKVAWLAGLSTGLCAVDPGFDPRLDHLSRTQFKKFFVVYGFSIVQMFKSIKWKWCHYKILMP